MFRALKEKYWIRMNVSTTKESIIAFVYLFYHCQITFFVDKVTVLRPSLKIHKKVYKSFINLSTLKFSNVTLDFFFNKQMIPMHEVLILPSRELRSLINNELKSQLQEFH